MRPSLATLAFVVLVTSVAAGAQERPANHPEVSSEISVTLVEIPVEVTRGGDPVQGLTAADFEVLEKSRPLPIVAFETIDLEGRDKPAASAAPAAPPSPAARRHLLFLYDFALSRPERLAHGITAARELVANGLAPSDMVAIAIYLPKGELQLLLSFTSDRAAAGRILAALERVLAGKEPAEVDRAGTDPLRLTGMGAESLLTQSFHMDERNFAGEMLASLGPSDGTWGSFLQHNVLYHSSVVQQANVEARQRSNVAGLAEGMAGLSDTLRSVVGRKYLTLFSEGFPMSIATRFPAGIGDPAMGGSYLFDKLDKTLGDLRRSGWVVHAVDLAGVRRNDQHSESLFFLANETGGVLVEGTNRLAQGLDGALRRSAHGYVLTVQADDVAYDGAYHTLKVRLRNTSRGVELHHRGGFFAPLPFSQQKDVQRLADAARLVAGDEEQDDLGVEVVAVPLRTGAQSSSVAVLVEVPGQRLLTSGAPRIGLEVFGYVLDEKGSSSDFFAQAVELDPAKVGARLARSGVRILGNLDLPPGQHLLRVLVRDRGNGRLSLLSVPLHLSATAAETGARLEALFLPPEDDPWLLVRPAEAAFDIHGRSVLPAAQATLPAAGEAQLLLVGHGFTGKGAWVRGRILTAEGKPATGGNVELLAVTPGEAGQPDLVTARLRTGSLPPGSYLLELRLGSDSGKPKAIAARRFQVTSAPGT